MLGIIVVLDHPGLELSGRLGGHLAVVGRVSEVLDVSLDVAGEERVGLAEDRKEHGEFLIGLLPFCGVGLVAEGGLELLRAIEGEIDGVDLAVGKEICATLALRFFRIAIVVEGRLVAAEDVNTKRKVGGIFAFGMEHWGREE